MQLTVYYGAMRSQMEPVLNEFKRQHPDIAIIVPVLRPATATERATKSCLEKQASERGKS
jgi:hypothetical protein